jgi:hypothetical protein
LTIGIMYTRLPFRRLHQRVVRRLQCTLEIS